MNTEKLTERCWRDDAMRVALQGFDNCEHHDALLHEVLRARPEAATLTFWPDRMQLLTYLQTLPGYGLLLTGRTDYYYEDREQVWPYLGWYGVEWEGAAVEVAMPPTTSDNGSVVCIGTDVAALARFTVAATEVANRPAGRCLRYTSQGWENALDMDAQMGAVTWDDVVLPPALMAGVREAVDGFFGGRAAYEAFGFAWKRGILLIGPPGTGKTMICKAIASSRPDLPFLYVRDLNPRERCQREVILDIFSRARALAPCVLAFEDMDGLIGDNNRTVFLNEMDGFKSNDGLLIIASSNHPGKIDEALLRRPSRFDRVFHIGLPGADERAEFCRRLLARPALAAHLSAELNTDALARRVAEKTDKFTPAYLKEAFIAAALSRAQAGVATLDGDFEAAVLHQVDELKAHIKRTRNPNALADLQGDTALGFRRA